MSKDQQKTYDAQTAKFLAVVSEHIPRLNSEEMQRWIEKPKALRRMLSHALSKPTIEYNEYSVHDKKTFWEGNSEDIPIPSDVVLCRGNIPLPVDDYEFSLKFGVEFDTRADKRHTLVLRPWILLDHKEFKGNEYETCFDLRSEDYLSSHQKMGFGFNTDLVLALLENWNCSLSNFIWELEMDYVDRAIEYVKKNYTMRLTIQEHVDNKWELCLFLLKDKASYTTFRVSLPKKALADALEEVEKFRAEEAAAPATS